MRFFRISFVYILVTILTTGAIPFTVRAGDIPFTVRQAVPLVHCGNRQGSGIVISSEHGYILTNAHVLLNLNTMKPDACEVGFLKDASSLKPSIYYTATWDRYIYDETRNQDFAILHIGQPLQADSLTTIPALKTDEFSKVGDSITILGFPSTAKGKQATTSGIIQGLERGIVKTNAVISPGASGGAGVDSHQNLIGVATRILYSELSNGMEEVIDYELVDIRSILSWLDTFGTNMHDAYVSHADDVRYHGPQIFITPGYLSCSLLAKGTDATTVYCLHNDGTRSVFPNGTTYHSWLADFSGVISLSPAELAKYTLSANITMKPGTLIKIATDPHVYVVSDVNGTIRWIASEDLARALYGEGWAGFVKDVPDTFFVNYHLGPPIE